VIGFGKQRMTNRGMFFYRGRDGDEDHRNGVGILLSTEAKKKKKKKVLRGWHTVSARITACFKMNV
jgi:hypothetical protein